MYASTSCKTCTRVHAYIQLEHAAHQLCVWMEFQILFWPTERQEFARADKAPPLKACLTLILTCWQQHVVHSMHKIYKLTHGQETSVNSCPTNTGRWSKANEMLHCLQSFHIRIHVSHLILLFSMALLTLTHLCVWSGEFCEDTHTNNIVSMVTYPAGSRVCLESWCILSSKNSNSCGTRNIRLLGIHGYLSCWELTSPK